MTDPFRTVLPPQRADFSIGHHDRLLLTGSCFTEEIGGRLRAAKFDVGINPCGIVYNPASMLDGLERLLAADRPYAQSELFERDGLWHSWDHHGAFSRPDRAEALAVINTAYARGAAALRRANRLLLTFGSADVFVHCATGRIVANNHKVPSSEFAQRRLGVAEIVEPAQELLHRLHAANPDLRVVLTVSPVRHLRLGAAANQRSKATLLLACAELTEALDYAVYFPAYELLLDDLRDYRFYAADLVHPSPTAVDYIWEYFQTMFFTAETRELVQRLEKLRTAVEHRPFHPGTAQHRAFVEVQLAIVERLQEEFPRLDFSKERAHFSGG